MSKGYGSDYDVVLLANFLHHFDAPANVAFLKRVHAAMRPGGILATVDFAPNEDRVREHAARLGRHEIRALYEIGGDVSPADFPV